MKRGASFLLGHLQKMVQATRAHTASSTSTLRASVSWKRGGEGRRGEGEEEEEGGSADGAAALRRERSASAAAAPEGRQRRRLSSDQSKSSKASTSVPVPSSFTAWRAKKNTTRGHTRGGDRVGQAGTAGPHWGRPNTSML